MASSATPKKTLLFLPENEPRRLKYTNSDRTRAFRSQPIDCIPSYLIPDGRSFTPPLLNLGWLIDTDRVVRWVQSKGYNPTISRGKNDVVPNVYEACLQAIDLMLDEDTGLIPYDPRIKLVFASDGDYVEDPLKHGKINFKLALKVGSNYEGAVPEEDMKRIGDLVAPGVVLKWFLDKDQWCWTRQQQEPQIVKLNVEDAVKRADYEPVASNTTKSRKRRRVAQ